MCSWISPVVRGLSPPCKAEDSGSNPGWGTKIPHVTEQLKPAHHNYRAHLPGLESMSCNERSHRTQWRACVLQLRPDAAKYINQCIYIYIYIYQKIIHIYLKTYTHISKNVYISKNIYIHIQKHTHVYIYRKIHAYVFLTSLGVPFL